MSELSKPSPCSTQGSHLLVIEDEADIRELIAYNLRKEGFHVVVAAGGTEGLRLAAQAPPDLILLDLMLPDIDGLEVCRRLKRDPALIGVPVVMVTAKGGESDIVAGLELGADDYITKPFSPRVLVARTRAVLRRLDAIPDDDSATIRIRDVEIHPSRFEVLVDGRSAQLSVTEFRVLHALARRPGWVLTRCQIVDAVHGGGYIATDRSIDVQIAGLRKKLGAAGAYIETVRGVGYRFRE
jgi:two-component system, OmpR family, alkaline phosphatase synthesis response regulator PhoP